MNIRQKVLEAFHEPCGYYHQEPHEQRNYIDGAFHVGLLYYAARKGLDTEICNKARKYLLMLQTYDCRTYGSEKLTDSWGKITPELYGHMKPQCFAGNVGYAFFNCHIPFLLGLKAILMILAFSLFPFLFFVKPFKQHLNSVMLAHLLLSTKPLWYKKRLTKNNPVYAYIYGVKLESYEPYPNISAWPAKDLWDWDRKMVKEQEYTPLCQLVGDMLQKSYVKKEIVDV